MINLSDAFEVDKTKDLNLPVLILDDICTTGSSLKAAVDLIKPYVNKDLKIVVIAKREFSKEELEKIKDKRFVLS